jgi:hypothetical protein
MATTAATAARPAAAAAEGEAVMLRPALTIALLLAACGTPATEPDAGPGDEPDAGCTAETDAELCEAAGRKCGGHTATDRCGTARTIETCGWTCGQHEVCGADGQCACQEPTPEERCAEENMQCGSLGQFTHCDHVLFTLDCGVCPEGKRCAVGNRCIDN